MPENVKANMVLKMMATRPEDIAMLKNKHHGKGFGKSKCLNFPKCREKYLMNSHILLEAIPGCFSV